MSIKQSHQLTRSLLFFIFSAFPFRFAFASEGGVWVEVKHCFEDLYQKIDDAKQINGRCLQTLSNVSDGRIVRLRSFYFTLDGCRLVVIDNLRGTEKLASAMQKCGAIAGVNGGFFHANRTPSGLEISGGKRVSAFKQSGFLSGFLVVSGKNFKLLRADEFSASQPKPDEALQAGPMLVDDSKAVAGLDDTHRATRTAIVTTDAENCPRFVVCESVTLAEFAQILVTRLIVGTRTVERALNLDGGSSTGMWIRGDKADVVIGNPSVNVRNYLAVIPR